MPLARLGRLETLTFLCPDFVLGKAEVLHQRNIRRAGGSAAAAFNAIEQMMHFGLVELTPTGEPVQLLGQQPYRTGFRAGTAANTGHRIERGRDFVFAQGQETVAGLDDRHLVAVQCNAHHRPAHQQAGHIRSIATGHALDQRTGGRAQPYVPVARLAQAAPGQGDHARDHRLATHHGTPDGGGRGNVLPHDALFAGMTLTGNFLARQRPDELLFRTGGVLAGYGANLDAPGLAKQPDDLIEGVHGLGFVVLDADQTLPRPGHVHQDQGALDDFRGALAHQAVIAGDVVLAFGAVEDHGVNGLVGGHGQLDGGREDGAAQADDTRLTHPVAQQQRVAFKVIRVRLQNLGRLVQTIDVNDNARRGQPRRVRHRSRFDGPHHAGGARMHRRTDESIGTGNALPPAHAITRFHQRSGRLTDVHRQRKNQLLRQGRRADGRFPRQAFVGFFGMRRRRSARAAGIADEFAQHQCASPAPFAA